MTADAIPPLDENARRYYLDVMGIQCWALIDRHNDNVKADGSGSVAFQAAGSISRQPETDLETNVQQCTRCELHTGRKQAITGRGSLSADLMFVLLAPGTSDDQSGMLCSGEADTLFSKMLSAINVAIDDVYITSLLKCCVPSRHTITTTELHYCAEFLKRQIQLVKPKLLVVAGNTAARCLLQRNSSLDDLRAIINPQTNADMASKSTVFSHQFESVPIFISYSPQELLLQPENKRKAWQDLQQMQKITETW